MFAQRHNTELSPAALAQAVTHGVYCSLEQLMALRWQAQHLALPKARRVSRPQSGMHHSRFRGRGMEFNEVRVYQPGDDVRSIDWRVTARRQAPHTRLYNEERERPVMILCDQSRSQFFGSHKAFKSVRAAQAAALFAWTALAHNDRVGGIVFSEQGHSETRPGRSRKSLLRLLHNIVTANQALSAEFNAEAKQALSLNGALTETLRIVKPGTLIVLISDFVQCDDETEALVAKLSRHNECLMVQTCDALEGQLPPPGRYPVSNGNDTLFFDARQKASRTRYEEWFRIREQRLYDLAIKYRCTHLRLSTDQEPGQSLQSMLISMGR
ncbi:MAG: DUF58 domain-containing protein [Oleiphilaceae bacterium]|nr:DUF58 domain-containing protein [Oleiphilaceae bacterium]